MENVRKEYPRPDFVRANWLTLNGEWDFAFDDEDRGHAQHWEKGFEKKHTIMVPFPFQSKSSGIEDTRFHDRMWYQRTFNDPRKDYSRDRVLLNFEGVDYFCEVYVNGHLLGTHTGSSNRFTLDATEHIKREGNLLVVYVLDPSRKTDIPRGKQYWHEKSASIWYNRTSGIWKSVWLEWVRPSHIEKAIIRPDIDKGTVNINLKIAKPAPFARATLKDKDGNLVSQVQIALTHEPYTLQLQAFGLPGVEPPHLWSPEDPYLYGLTLQLLDTKSRPLDTVETYVGMRAIECRNGMVYLNHQPYFQKLVLDQGYWPESLLAAPSVEALRFDIEAAKKMGFNGCRKHQKVEDPYFYYLADKLGFLVWADCPGAATFSEDLVGRISEEFREEVEQNVNHPSIIAWVPFNESWGVPQIGFDKQQQALASSLYFAAKALDPTRLVISNDGWEHTFSDLVTIHNYMHGADPEGRMAKDFKETMEDKTFMLTAEPAAKRIFAEGYEYSGQPIVVSEFGGVSYEPSASLKQADSWGYTTSKDEASYVADLTRIFTDIGSNRVICGYCYTQLSDVEQEQNGLLTYDRRFKVDPEKIKKINDSIALLPVHEEVI